MRNDKVLFVMVFATIISALGLSTYLSEKSGGDRFGFIVRAVFPPAKPTPSVLTAPEKERIAGLIKSSRISSLSPYQTLTVKEFKQKLPIEDTSVSIRFSPELNQFLISLKSNRAMSQLDSIMKNSNVTDLYTSGSNLFFVHQGDAAATYTAAAAHLDNEVQRIYDQNNVAGIAANAQVTGTPDPNYIDPDEPIMPDQNDIGAAIDMAQGLLRFGDDDKLIAEPERTPPPLTDPGQLPVDPTYPTAPVGIGETIEVRGIRVHTSIAARVEAMLAAAQADGITLTGSGWRDIEDQKALRRQNCGPTDYDIYQKPSDDCSPPTARPGTSNHEFGLAIDFRCNGARMETGDECFNWMRSHAATYGFYNLPSESWHWSVNGS